MTFTYTVYEHGGQGITVSRKRVSLFRCTYLHDYSVYVPIGYTEGY